jgi:hypothetical protein
MNIATSAGISLRPDLSAYQETVKTQANDGIGEHPGVPFAQIRQKGREYGHS